MKITLRYSVLTKEGSVIPDIKESFQCLENDDSTREPARARFKELRAADFIANLEYQIEEVTKYHVVKARYEPKGKIYHFEVDFKVKKGFGLEVDSVDCPWKHVYVVAASDDYDATEEELQFDIRKLRKAYKPE